MTGRAAAAAVAAFTAVTAFATGCTGEACGPAEAVVDRVIDGDTIVAGGATIRYLLVDAPEATGGDAGCYGGVAARFNADLVLGRTVQLGYDAACRDRYGRALAYVATEGLDVNRLLIERGYACVLHIPPGGDDRVDELSAVQAATRTARRGLWGACDPIPCK